MKKNTRSKYRNDLTGEHIFDYKDPLSLSKFISDGGKITPARISKLSIAQQRKVAGAVKKARNLALIPSGSSAYDGFYRGGEQVTPAPFEY